jgi:hypothetical protein
MSMEQIGELGYFVIKTIETYNVEETIALSKKTADSSLVRVSLSCIVPFNMSHRLDVCSGPSLQPTDDYWVCSQ